MKNSLNERISFEKMISDLSATFINLPATEVDKHIDEGLCRLGKFFEVERCFIFQFSKDRIQSHVYAWFANNIKPDWGILLGIYDKKLQVLADSLLHNEPVVYTKAEDIPHQARIVRNYVSKVGIKSCILIPIQVGGQVRGALVLDDRREFANPERFPQADKIIAADYPNAFGQISVDGFSYLVIVTRDHAYDQTVLEWAITTDAKYIGMIGSRKKIKTIISVRLTLK